MTQPTPLFQLAEARLGSSLDAYVAERRATTSWRAMAADLTARTGVQLTGETLRVWFADRIEVTVKPSAGAA